MIIKNLKKIFLVLILVTIVSCKVDRNLEMHILNSKLEIKKISINNVKQYYEKLNASSLNYKHRIKFYIENKTSKIYYLVLDPKNNDSGRLVGYLNYARLNFYQKDILLRPDRQFPNYMYKSQELNYLKYRDSLNINSLNNSRDKEWRLKAKSFEKNKILIHPGESLYFEEYISLPVEFYDDLLNFSVLDFDYQKNYTCQINFELLTKDEILKFLTESELKNIKENKYEILEGELSSQKIQVEFIN